MGPSDVYRDVTAEVVAAAIAGEGLLEAQEARVAGLFDAHHARLYRLARRMSRDRDAARDLVQETFLRAARAIDSVPSGEGTEAAWLVRVLVNICKDQWRRQARDRRWRAAASAPVEGPHPEASIIARTTVWRALDRLAPRRRAALVLYELEGVGIPEIARLLGMSPVTVRWHLSRGRRDLARVISGDD